MTPLTGHLTPSNRELPARQPDQHTPTRAVVVPASIRAVSSS